MVPSNLYMKVETKEKTELKKRQKAECRGEEYQRSPLLLTPLPLHYNPVEVQSSVEPILGTDWQAMFLDKLLHRMIEARAGGAESACNYSGQGSHQKSSSVASSRA